MEKFQGELFIQNIKRTIVRNKRKSVQLSTFPPVFHMPEVRVNQVKGGGLGAEDRQGQYVDLRRLRSASEDPLPAVT